MFLHQKTNCSVVSRKLTTFQYWSHTKHVMTLGELTTKYFNVKADSNVHKG